MTNQGVPFSAYTRTVVIDPGVDIDGGTTVQPLPIYNRPVSAFGADRYLLTNNPDIQSTFTGVDVTAQVTKERLLRPGRRHGRAVGGLGEQPRLSATTRTTSPCSARCSRIPTPTRSRRRGSSPNGATRCTRAASINLPTTFVLAWRRATRTASTSRAWWWRPISTRAPIWCGRSATARRGSPSPARSTPGSRKGSCGPGYRIDALLDVFNLLNLVYEVEEVTVSGPTSRQTSAIQPPRSLHIGVRVSF